MKSKIFLDYSNCQSVKDSILRSYRTDNSSIIDFVEELTVPDSSRPPDFLLEAICEEFGYPHYEYEALWFHGTRTSDPDLFWQYGILPKTAARQHFIDLLVKLSEGLTRKGDNPFNLSLAGKQSQADEGPFGVLFKSVATSPVEDAHNYCEAPESVEDIAGTLLGENYRELLARFQAATKQRYGGCPVRRSVILLGEALRWMSC